MHLDASFHLKVQSRSNSTHFLETRALKARTEQLVPATVIVLVAPLQDFETILLGWSGLRLKVVCRWGGARLSVASAPLDELHLLAPLRPSLEPFLSHGIFFVILISI